ncbi:NADH dehydrogenase [ubiquinone] 1 beta subcomplex subunit 4 [Varanus komodoensis]|uniref:NADH dehydrogenase [ubiquinone] 1 beta subcomplex subunit 4 n=1 Tax=Varanus komodoensis TaxID=61221 RepID=A0A8D2JJQ3_VARKO|nr:NADH dehydrogenase [ubiquinone] 1 beta subcomplex subunit 4 [Varanus komodoensis]KAF7238123.1 NADH dehydrogenase [ubiquinone] 1 beta subcomplex subunit 4 [Varanus komodoensis]
MAEPSSPEPVFQYRPAPLSSLPPQLDPAEYAASPEKRRLDAERLALRARLKREFLMQLNDPQRPSVIEDPAMTRWTYAKSHNIYPNFRATPKTSLTGIVFGVGPILFWWYLFKKQRDHREKLIQEGKYKRPFNLCF